MPPTNEHDDPPDNREEKAQIRMTAAEKTKFIRAAAAKGLSLSSWARMVMVEAANAATDAKGDRK